MPFILVPPFFPQQDCSLPDIGVKIGAKPDGDVLEEGVDSEQGV
jgi:hypothetical protein